MQSGTKTKTEWYFYDPWRLVVSHVAKLQVGHRKKVLTLMNGRKWLLF